MRNNYLGQKPAEILARAFQHLPHTVDSLNLTDNELHLKTPEEFRQIFAALPFITSLNLKNNILGTKTRAEIAEILQALPNTVKSLNLGGNTTLTLDHPIPRRNAAEVLVHMLQSLPPHITSLSLSGSGLGRQDTDAFIQILQAVPPTVKSLNLENNDLFHKDTAELIRIFQALPATIHALYLDMNFSSRKTTAELCQILHSLLPTITFLSLKAHAFYLKLAAELIAILAAIPASVNSLNLAANSLGRKSPAELIQILRALPLTIRSLSLEESALYLLNSDHLVQVFQAIPRTVSFLNIGRNNLVRTPAELVEILESLPDAISALDLSWNSLDSYTHFDPSHTTTIKTVYISEAEAIAMHASGTLEQFVTMFPQIEKVILTHENGAIASDATRERLGLPNRDGPLGARTKPALRAPRQEIGDPSLEASSSTAASPIQDTLLHIEDIQQDSFASQAPQTTLAFAHYSSPIPSSNAERSPEQSTAATATVFENSSTLPEAVNLRLNISLDDLI